MTNDTAHARTTDPVTSHEAAASVQNLSLYRQRVLAFVQAFGPITDEDIIGCFEASDYPHSPSGVRTRRAELVTSGHIRWSGLYGVMSTGRRARTWEVNR